MVRMEAMSMATHCPCPPSSFLLRPYNMPYCHGLRSLFLQLLVSVLPYTAHRDLYPISLLRTHFLHRATATVGIHQNLFSLLNSHESDSWALAGAFLETRLPKVTDQVLHSHAPKVICHHPVSSSQVSNSQAYSGGDWG